METKEAVKKTTRSYPGLSERLNQELDRYKECPKGTSRTRWVANHYDVARSTAHGWLQADQRPHLRKLEEIAKDLNVTPNYIELGVIDSGEELTTNINTKQMHGLMMPCYQRAQALGLLIDDIDPEIWSMITESTIQHTMKYRLNKPDLNLIDSMLQLYIKTRSLR